jgi:hypothetical protein
VGDQSYTFFFTMLLSGTRCTCPNQANLCALMSSMFIHPDLIIIFLFSPSPSQLTGKRVITCHNARGCCCLFLAGVKIVH